MSKINNKEKDDSIDTSSVEYQEWINSFSGIGGRSYIGERDVTYEPVDLSEFVTPTHYNFGE